LHCGLHEKVLFDVKVTNGKYRNEALYSARSPLARTRIQKPGEPPQKEDCCNL
jgi:hypothetical protein